MTGDGSPEGGGAAWDVFTRLGQCVQFLAECVQFSGQRVHYPAECLQFRGPCARGRGVRGEGRGARVGVGGWEPLALVGCQGCGATGSPGALGALGLIRALGPPPSAGSGQAMVMLPAIGGPRLRAAWAARPGHHERGGRGEEGTHKGRLTWRQEGAHKGRPYMEKTAGDDGDVSTTSGRCVQFSARCVNFWAECVHFGGGSVQFLAAGAGWGSGTEGRREILLRQAQDRLRQAQGRLFGGFAGYRTDRERQLGGTAGRLARRARSWRRRWVTVNQVWTLAASGGGPAGVEMAGGGAGAGAGVERTGRSVP